MATTPTPTNTTSSLDAGLIWFDGEIVPQERAVVSVLTHAMHYGTSVFEGIRAYETARGAAVFRLREHSQRLLESAKILGMKPTWTVEQIDQAILETVRANRPQELLHPAADLVRGRIARRQPGAQPAALHGRDAAVGDLPG
jgi:branched-subunit amino acid aminotransferase/4-amino-4-deoxychorismate lyase